MMRNVIAAVAMIFGALGIVSFLVQYLQQRAANRPHYSNVPYQPPSVSSPRDLQPKNPEPTKPANR